MVQLAGATHWFAKPLADLVGLDTAALAQYLTANSYLKASDISSYLTWANLSDKPTVYPTSWELVTGRPTKLSDLTDDVVAGNYLPKPTWDAVFEVVTVDGTPVLKVKYDILGLKGITAYADGTLSGGFSGALVDLVDVAVTNLASGDILKYNGTHFVNVPVSSIAGASSWDQITGKPSITRPGGRTCPVHPRLFRPLTYTRGQSGLETDLYCRRSRGGGFERRGEMFPEALMPLPI